ncbi:MAG: nucleotidyltransferase family protein [Candidatus Omnitrophica bacterium]|nr:nucleotidyltransferase family protein [Candidatus Omnitrophota bacterium]
MSIDRTDAVILCGGLGTRLKSVAPDVPKVMVDVNGRPFLDIQLGHLKRQGITRVVLCTGYKGDMIEDYYRKNPQGFTFEFSRETQPLGTGGAIKNARYLIESDPFLAFNGDCFCAVDLKGLLDFHAAKMARASLVVAETKEAGGFGKINLDDSRRILGFLEKAAEGHVPFANVGVYCFDEGAFTLMPDEERFSLEYDFFPNLVDKGFYGFPTPEKFYDIGTPERYELIKKVFAKGTPP